MFPKKKTRRQRNRNQRDEEMRVITLKECPRMHHNKKKWNRVNETCIILLKLHPYENEIAGIVIIRARCNKFKPDIKETPN